jgi:hypothetical protein
MVHVDGSVTVELELAVDFRATERFRFLLRYADEDDRIPYAPLPSEIVAISSFALCAGTDKPESDPVPAAFSRRHGTFP